MTNAEIQSAINALDRSALKENDLFAIAMAVLENCLHADVDKPNWGSTDDIDTRACLSLERRLGDDRMRTDGGSLAESNIDNCLSAVYALRALYGAIGNNKELLLQRAYSQIEMVNTRL